MHSRLSPMPLNGMEKNSTLALHCSTHQGTVLQIAKHVVGEGFGSTHWVKGIPFVWAS